MAVLNPQRSRISQLLLVLGSSLMLTACPNSGNQTNTGNPASSGLPNTVGSNGPFGKYDLFNQCFVMKADGTYVTRNGSDFKADGEQVAEAELFYMRAANLARYLFYTPDEMLLTANGSSVFTVPQAYAEDGSDWTFEETGDNGLTASTLGGFLAVGDDNTLVLADTPARLEFERASGCAEYPEMPLAITGKSYTGDVNQPVIGFAEVHTHMANADQLSDGSTADGAAAAGLLYGHAVDRFGVTHALDNCEAVHGPNGATDVEASVIDMEPGRTHDTQGWPSFVDWPKGDSMLHQQMYWRWIERAWLSGLRVASLLGTNIEALCEFGRDVTNSQLHYEGEVDCKDMSIGMKQVNYLYVIQDYIDAQYGGPGEGFFRIVGDPAEAREVIAEGKLAVIPGLEFSNLFGCNVTFNPDGTETRHCTKEQIDSEIDRAWDAGVRQIYPYHDVDSALGGTGLFWDTLNLVGWYGTQGFWKTSACENGGEGDMFFYSAGVDLSTGPSTGGVVVGDDPISQGIAGLFADTILPIYEPGRQCNTRTITDLGVYALDKMMKKGFIIDIDHAAYRSKQLMLDYAATMEPDYPMFSGHGGQGGINKAQIHQVYRQGGLVYPASQNGHGHVNFTNIIREYWEAQNSTLPFAVGFGSDANGFRNLPGPRGAARISETQAVEYPFRIFEGPDWSSRFDNIDPVTIDILTVPGDNGKMWNVNEGGVYHYGLMADVIEEIRIEGGKEALDALYNSAEAFIQVWETTEEAAANARTKPTPDALPVQ